jgi:succinoglycan biosynthesis transport protein ExoP
MEEREQETRWQDYWAVAVRRRWFFLGTLFAVALVATLAAAFWPVRYRSEALVLVEQQNVPTKYVEPNVLTNAQQQLQSITQLVLSRTRLARLISKYGLYPNEPDRQDTDRLVRRMRKDITLQAVQTSNRGELTAFKIFFTYKNPVVAQEVNSDLTGEFITRSLQSQTQQSVSTTDFFKSQLDEAGKDLAEKGLELRKYKTRYLGELPEQEQSNLQVLSGYEAQLYADSNALDRAEQERTYLKSLLSAYKGMAPSGLPSSPGDPSPLVALNKQITAVQEHLTDLEAMYTPNYPTVTSTKQELTELQRKRQKLLASASKDSAKKTATPASATAASSPDTAQVGSRLNANRTVIAYHKREIQELKKKISGVQSRLQLTPLREQQLTAVTRDYQNARAHYQQLLQKKLQSQLATSLVQREQGERFQLIDPPSLPQRPVLPNKLEIILGGWGGGLTLGVGLVALLESTDERLYDTEDIGHLAPHPVLMRLPLLASPKDERLRFVKRLAEGAGIVLLTLLAAGLGLYVFHMR